MDKESIQEAKKLYTKPPCPIEIIVRNPISHMEHKKPFTDYEVCCKVLQIIYLTLDQFTIF